MLTANKETRTISGMVLPFGETGYTNKGAVTASAGTLTLPTDAATVTLNMEHERQRPVGRGVELEEREDGIHGSFRVAATSAGDDLLEEVAEGLRTGFSVEIEQTVIRAGTLLGGVLRACAAVVDPAFDSARMTAADAGELDGASNEPDKETDASADPAGDEEEEGEATMADTVAASVPVGTKPTTKKKGPESLREAADTLAASFKRGGESALLAALTDITHDDGDNDGDGLGEITEPKGWLGQVWKDIAYQRLFIPLLAQGTLASYRETGFRFTTLPTVAKYAGNKATVPSTGMSAEPVNYGTQRWANAADIDRRFVDFGDSEVIQAFISANAESYAEVTDIWTLEELLDAGVAALPGTVPEGVNEATAAIVDGALALIADGLKPSAAIVGADLYRELVLTPKDKVSEFLSESVGLETGSVSGFKIVPSAHADTLGKVSVLDGRTIRFKELGSTPIRVEAEHIDKGGRDIGVFGYTSFQVLKSGGVRTLDLDAGGA